MLELGLLRQLCTKLACSRPCQLTTSCERYHCADICLVLSQATSNAIYNQVMLFSKNAQNVSDDAQKGCNLSGTAGFAYRKRKASQARPTGELHVGFATGGSEYNDQRPGRLDSANVAPFGARLLHCGMHKVIEWGTETSDLAAALEGSTLVMTSLTRQNRNCVKRSKLLAWLPLLAAKEIGTCKLKPVQILQRRQQLDLLWLIQLMAMAQFMQHAPRPL